MILIRTLRFKLSGVVVSAILKKEDLNACHTVEPVHSPTSISTCDKSTMED